jgi:hypothetical protein
MLWLNSPGPKRSPQSLSSSSVIRGESRGQDRKVLSVYVRFSGAPPGGCLVCDEVRFIPFPEPVN